MSFDIWCRSGGCGRKADIGPVLLKKKEMGQI